MTHECWSASIQSPTRGSSGSDMNIASIIPLHVAGLALAVLLSVTLVTLLPGMATVQLTRRKRHIAFLVSSAVLMSFFLVIIMIDIAALI